MDEERGLDFVKVTMTPAAVAFSAVALGDLCLNLRVHLGPTGSAILLILAGLMALAFVAGIVVGASLFFFGWPKALVPPSLRR